jgi:hypothetical protein
MSDINTTQDTTNDIAKPIRYKCRHIFHDGHRCGSPALREEEFCYYHHTSRRPIQEAPTRRRRQSRFTVPSPEDRSAIQTSIGLVLTRLASNDLDPRRAGLLLYGLQIASLNLGKPVLAEPATTVDQIVLDPTHGPIAEPAEMELPASERPSELTLLFKKFLEEDPLDEEETDSAKPATTASIILPDIQAVAATPPTSMSQTVYRFSGIETITAGAWNVPETLLRTHDHAALLHAGAGSELSAFTASAGGE